mmetsp:Transcript_8436/g.13962  ORF Transcript_8436/g.13962 Transcript_8436/m.13962 type:complete len:383 (+) Transcript_8436:195-1343(+)
MIANPALNLNGDVGDVIFLENPGDISRSHKTSNLQIEKPQSNTNNTLLSNLESVHNTIILDKKFRFSRRRTTALSTAILFSMNQTGAFSSTTTSKNTMSSSCAASSANIRVISNDKLHVSEPDPSWFGNGPNKKDDPAWTNSNWLKSRFHFSFAEYSKSGNQRFGKLRVMNDDLVQPHTGFGQHSHANMEIITYVVHGGLYHKDSMGTKETLDRGAIQFMTAGTGVRHEEFNHEDTPLRFIQTWIVPRSQGLKPNYGSSGGSLKGRKNQFQHLVSDTKNANVSTPVEINQNVDVFATELDLAKKLEVELPEGRMAYLLCVEGEVKINGQELKKHDGCEISTESGGGKLEIEATDVEATETGNVAHVLMFSVEAEKGAGRSDF